MLAQKHALVGGVDGDCVVTDPRLVHIVEKTLDVLVDGRDAVQVVLEILLLGRANAIVATHARDIQVARGVIALLPIAHAFGELEHGGTDCKRPCAAVALVLEERGWLRYLDAVEKRLVSRRVFPQPVWGFVVAHEKEGSVRVSILEPFQREVCDHVGGVSFVLLPPCLLFCHTLPFSLSRGLK